MRPAAGLGRVAGSAAGSTLALALLVCGCVFTAMSGPALSLHVRSEAFHQTMASLASTVKTAQVTASWSDFTTLLAGAPAGAGVTAGGPPGAGLTAGQLRQATQEIKSSL